MLRTFCFVLFSLCISIPGQAQVCNNWLQTPAAGSRISIGDLDVSGSKLTVEAMINRTQPYTGGYVWAGDVVSKHINPTDANYLLRPNSAEITTTNGYFLTPAICEISLNKTYHIAMVYDGTSLKFYRNGFLMSQVAASGDLYQNDFETWIGYYNAQLHNTSFIGYINDVRIWNVARTQAQIRATMNVPLVTPGTIPGLVGYYLFNNLDNKQGNTAFNGISGGAATINASNPTCPAFVADSCFTACSINEDFDFKVNVCRPLTSEFKSTSNNHSAIKWQFGDGSEMTGQNTVTHTYAGGGDYEVNMILTVGACTHTVRKRVLVDVQPQDIVLTPDTTICPGATKLLRTSAALNFCWFPTTYLNDPLSPNPTTNTPSDITYFFTAEVAGANLIDNGNFSLGNIGFTSEYTFNPLTANEGIYFVGTNSKSWNVAMNACGDHTTGAGNMMMINGSFIPYVKVWTKTVNVNPNTNYAFSTWTQALSNREPTQLNFVINGNQIGSTTISNLPTCTWRQFNATWNSGNATTATISIVNNNAIPQANDFALDDISFSPVLIKRDSVKITVEKPVVRTTKDTAICFGAFVQLNSSGATTYSWNPGNTLSNPNIGNPIAQPQTSSRFIVTGTTSSGCQAKDTVDITVFTKNAISASNDTLICASSSVQLNATGGVSYKWSPTSTLNNSFVNNPVATPSQTTNYIVVMVDANSCIFKDTIRVSLKTYPAFRISADTSICAGTTLTLNAGGGDVYQWSPSATLDNPQTASPLVTPVTSSSYTVYVKDNTCLYDTTMAVNITLASSPNITATKLADIDCQNPSTQLRASGAVSYAWTPTHALDDPRKQNPIVTIDSTTTFILTGKDQNGCSGKDSVTVSVSKTGLPLFVLPNAFTPNNDGKNDCFGIKRWGNVEIIHLAVYNRWGQIVFETKDPKKCWDGRFKGQIQPSGGYVYIIKAKSFCGDILRKGALMLLN